MSQEQVQELTLAESKATYWSWLAGFLALALVLPILPAQFISGPLVNAMLIIVTVVLGKRSAWALALIPSPVALLTGVLPLALMPMVPLIMISNLILIWGFDVWRNKNFFLALGLGSVLKFLFLFGTSHLLNTVYLHGALPKPILLMMSYPQLLTALMGGVIAYAFLKTLKKI
jgi:hypothetical protein